MYNHISDFKTKHFRCVPNNYFKNVGCVAEKIRGQICERVAESRELFQLGWRVELLYCVLYKMKNIKWTTFKLNNMMNFYKTIDLLSNGKKYIKYFAEISALCVHFIYRHLPKVLKKLFIKSLQIIMCKC